MTELFENLLKDSKEINIRTEKKVSMSKKTSFRIGGEADIALFPSDITQFKWALDKCTGLGIPFYVMGRGSNLLVSDEGFRGAVIFTELMNSCRFEGNIVTAGAGASLTALSRQAGAEGLSGLEFACGIPGSVGGGVAMNAGAYGGEVSDVFKSCVFYRQGEGIMTCDKEDGMFSYRNTTFLKNRDYVLEASFLLTQGNPEDIKRCEEELLSKRREKQPLEYPSAGSAFKRPEGFFAAKLIEDAGLKGLRVGDAQVSEKHSGFIINLGNATSRDVTELICRVRDEVNRQYGVVLEPEVRYLSPKGEQAV